MAAWMANGPAGKATPWIFTVAVIVAIFVVTWFTLEVPLLHGHHRHYRPSAQDTYDNDHSPSLRQLLRALYPPSTALDASSFRDPSGTEWRLEGQASWKQPLGKRLCIVDIDTRRLSKSGMLNHYMYAMIHGYDYHFIQTEELPDRAPYWTKPIALSRVLANYDVCVSIDADAIFTRLDLPFEWLLNRWGYQRGETSIAMALDPAKAWNADSKGRTSINAGFVIAQNLARTHDMLAAWDSCPDDEVRFPNCSRWKEPWPAEQRAFADYIRYEYDRPSDVLEIPCTEANGYPEAGQGCNGTFVRHFWLKKAQLLKPGVAATLAQGLLGSAHESLLSNEASVVLVDRPAGGRRQDRVR